MADFEAKSPDGQVYKIQGPDGATPEEAAQILASQLPQAPAAPNAATSVLDGAKRFGVDAVAGFGKVAAEIPRVASWMLPAGGKLDPTINWLEKESGDVKSFYERLGKEQGREPGYGKTIAEALGGGMASGGITPGAMVGAAAAGGGSELAAQTLGDSAWARLGGGLAGGALGSIVAGVVSRRAPNVQALARETMEGLDERTLLRAQKFQAAQAKQGVQIDLAQALEGIGAPASNVKTVRDYLANSPQGNRVQEILRNQPGQLSQEADLTVARMPGRNFGPGQAANNMQEAATAAVNAAKQERSRQVKAFYGQAGTLTPAQVKELDSLAEAFVGQPGMTDDVKRAVAVFRGKLSGQDTNLQQAVDAARKAVAGASDAKSRLVAQQQLASANAALAGATKKPVSALDVDTWIGEMTGPFKGTPLNPADPKAAGQIKGLGGQINKKFQELSPEVKRAEEEFARLSEQLVNPIKQSIVGQVATPRGYRPDVQATMDRFTGLMTRGTDANAKVSDIRTLGEQLAKTDPNAFADALKTYISGRVKAAMEPGGTSQTAANNPDMAARIAQSLWGNELQAQGLRDALAIAAKSTGTSPDEAVRGLNNLMQLTRATRSRPQSVGGLRPQDIENIGGSNMLANSMRVFGFLPFERAARGQERVVLGSTLRQLDTILTSPEGAKMLADLGKMSVMDRRIPILLGQFGAQVATNPSGVMPE